MIVSAKNYPRGEEAAFAKVMRACERISFAEDAFYSFPRGGKDVSGPSVYFAREAARIWGNLRYGFYPMQSGPDTIMVRGYALDLEANHYVESSAEFKKLIQRKNRQTGVSEWVQPDERDLRELINKHGAICERNAILKIVPADLVSDAMVRATETLRKKANGDLQESREETVKRIVMAFDELGVNAEMIETKLGHKLSLISAEEVVDLKGVYKSIRDGHSSRKEHFEFEGQSKSDELNKKIKKKEVEPGVNI
jgi:hypothetical protein